MPQKTQEALAHVDRIESRDQELFDSIAERYAKKDQTASTRIARRYQLLRAVEPILNGPPVKCMVEIACGPGASAEYLRGHYCRYIGLDHSAEMIRFARWSSKGNPNATFLHANAKDKLDLEAPADLILAVGALHHMTDLDEVFAAIRSYAAPSARFIAIEPAACNPVVQLLRTVRAKVDLGYSADQQYYKDNELHELLQRNGLKDIEITHQGYFTPPFAQVILKPQTIFTLLSQAAVLADRFIDQRLNDLLSPLSWNVFARARMP